MKYYLAFAVALFGSAAATAQVATPDRPITDPRSLTSPVDPEAGPVPVEDLASTPEIYAVAASPDGEAVFLTTDLTGRANIWRVDSAGSWPLRLTRSDDNQFVISTSPDGRTVYFRQDAGGGEYFDIYAVSADGGPVRNLTATPDIDEREALPSQDGRSLAITTKLLAAGQIDIGILDLETGEIANLTHEADSQWNWAPVAWVDDGRAIIANRYFIDGSASEIWRIDVRSSDKRRLLGESAVIYSASDASPDGSVVALTTNAATGVNQAAILYTDGSLRMIAPTPWDQASGALSPDGSSVIVTTNADGRTSIESVALSDMRRTPVAMPPGVNRMAMSHPFLGSSGTLLIKYQGAASPSELAVADIQAGSYRQLTRLAPGSLRTDHLPRSEIVTYRSFDGTPISAVVTMPFNLKRDGSNPAIVFPHGGPDSQAIDWFYPTPTIFASRGYIVIQPNFRGSTGYGTAFQKANFQDLGGGDLKDVLGARQFLIDSGYADAKRIGITGGSYGGFMTLMAIGKNPDAFAAAVQRYGIIDWFSMYEKQDASLRAYQTSLLGTPTDAPDVYRASSPMTYIDNATAPLLSLHGENDIRVPLGQVSEIIVFPEEGHGFYKRENVIRTYQATIDWFEKYLQGED